VYSFKRKLGTQCERCWCQVEVISSGEALLGWADASCFDDHAPPNLTGALPAWKLRVRDG
jgi:hypothetical protein